MQNFLGLEGFTWFQGVVEDNNDPLKLGRCRIRIIGLHSESKSLDDQTGQGIPTNKLPWAHPLQPITSAAISGIGSSPTGILQGTHVIGFSRDGDAFQDLVIMGTIGGQVQSLADTTKGFNDPDGVYPKNIENDTNRLTRNEQISETIVQTKKDTLTLNVPKANGTGNWNESNSSYNAEYPKNQVHETESGHIVEFDDTPGSERIQEYHKSGTFKEIYPGGSRVDRIVKDHYEITYGDNFVNVKGKCDVTVDGNTTLYIKGNQDKQVDQNVNVHILGNVSEQIDGNLDQTVNGNVTQTVLGDMSQTINGNMTASINGGAKIDVNGNTDFTCPLVNWVGDMKFIGDIEIKGGMTLTNDCVAQFNGVNTGISLIKHNHSGIFPGGATTQQPNTSVVQDLIP